MTSRHIHHTHSRVHVHVRDDDGVVSSHRADGLVGSDGFYETMTRGLASKLRPGEWLDTAEADREHRRVLAVRAECIAAVHASTGG